MIVVLQIAKILLQFIQHVFFQVIICVKQNLIVKILAHAPFHRTKVAPIYHRLDFLTLNNTRQQIFVYLFFLVFLDGFGVADADFGVSFCVVSTVSKIFATN